MFARGVKERFIRLCRRTRYFFEDIAVFLKRSISDFSQLVFLMFFPVLIPMCFFRFKRDKELAAEVKELILKNKVKDVEKRRGKNEN